LQNTLRRTDVSVQVLRASSKPTVNTSFILRAYAHEFAVIEMSKSKWLVAAVVPGLKRQPLKKLDADEDSLLKLLHRWRREAEKAGHPIKRVVGRDGFWLARWLRARDVEAYVIRPTSIAVSREHRRAKTDRLDTEKKY
jgi:transposase